MPQPKPLRLAGAGAFAVLILGLIAVVGALGAAPALSPARDAAQAGMVDVATLAPGLQVDMRYAGEHNFTGRRVPGYEAGTCLLLRPAAEALARAQAALRAQGQGLRVYDCYRPVRAVRAFVDWARGPDQERKRSHYPNVDKSALIPEYIAETSGHSRGATVDLGLLDCRRMPCRAMDMGTDFDFFDPRAHTDAPGLSKAQRANRLRLLRALRAAGFQPYAQEWWHFTFRPEPTPDTAYDFPVR